MKAVKDDKENNTKMQCHGQARLVSLGAVKLILSDYSEDRKGRDVGKFSLTLPRSDLAEVKTCHLISRRL